RLNRVKQQLQQSSYKLTPQREATLRVLIENEKDHLSAEDVYLKVKDKSPEIGLATVYRTLELLAELKVVDKINFGDGVTLFDLRKEGAKHFHHHLVCMECGKVEEIEEDLLPRVEERVENEFEFKILDHRLTFHGICASCQAKGKKFKKYYFRNRGSTVKNIIDKYLNFIQLEKELSENKVGAYRGDLKKYDEYLP